MLRLAAGATLLAVTVLGCASAPDQTQPPGSVYVSAINLTFKEGVVVAPANEAFQIYFENLENVPHNVDVVDGSGTSLARGEVFNGRAGRALPVPALGQGSYTLLCNVHPETMRAALVVR
jgi:plastocyanin